MFIEFAGNIVGFIGENGSGKSNCLKALNYAYEGALSGETRDPTTKRLPIVKWGAEAGHVKVTFEHKGKDGEITRTFSHKKSDANFKYDSLEYQGTTVVNKAIADVLGIDKDICRQAIFIGQDELDSILFTDPRNRKMAWQKLCGIGQVNDIHTKLGKFISTQEPIRNYDENIMDAGMQLKELVDQQYEKERELVGVKHSKGGKDVTVYSARVEELNSLMVLRDQAIGLSKEVNAIEEKEVSCTASLNNLVPDGIDIIKKEEELKGLNEQKTKAESSRTMAEFFDSYTAKAADAKAKLKGAEDVSRVAVPSRESIDAEKVKLDTLNAEVSGLRSKLAMYTQLSSVADTSGAVEDCVLCGQHLEDAEAVKAHVTSAGEKLHTELESKHGAASTLSMSVNTNYDKRGEADRNVQYWQGELSSAEENLKKLEGQSFDFDPQVHDGLVRSIDTLDREIKNSRIIQNEVVRITESIRSLAEQKEHKKAALVSTLDKSREICTRLNETPLDLEGKVAEAKKVFTELQDLALKEAQLTGAITQVKASIATLEVTKAKLIESKEAQAGRVSRMAVLEAAREWFHYNNGPSVIINNLLDEITIAVNDFLEKFDSLFSVVPNYESMSFNYYYHDPDIPTADPLPHCSEMSGGEKVVLAVAFRLATYAMFAQRVGILVLDEPSVYLDSKNVGKLGTLLYNIKSLAKNLGLQVFISTHEETIMNHFDKIVNFGNKNKKEQEDE